MFAYTLADPTESCVFEIDVNFLDAVFHCVFTNSKSYAVLYNIVTLSGKFNKFYLSKIPFKSFKHSLVASKQ